MTSAGDGPEIAERLASILNEFRATMRIDERTEWRVIEAHKKRKKLLFEVEEVHGEECRTFVGRVAEVGRNRACFQALEVLWAAGLRPPSNFTVPRPVGHLANWEAILQEKAPGELLHHLIAGEAATAQRSAAMAGEWLNALHSLPLEVPDRGDFRPRLDTWHTALKQLSPGHSTMLDQIHGQIVRELADEPVGALVSSHGDFHATNILISESGRVTGIDLDNFAGRERAADIGYFLGQTAARGYRRTGSFASTGDVRRAFVQGYSAAAGGMMPPRLRIGSYTSAAFLRLLHDDLHLMKSGRTDLLDPWLTAAELSAFGKDF